VSGSLLDEGYQVKASSRVTSEDLLARAVHYVARERDARTSVLSAAGT
jgi:hypothetical protein